RKGLHFADLDAVEGDAGSGGETRHGAFEHDEIALAAAREVRDPKDEDEGEGESAQNETADHQIVGLGFHRPSTTVRRHSRSAVVARWGLPRVPAPRRNIPESTGDWAGSAVRPATPSA